MTDGADGPQLESIVQSASWPAGAEMVARCIVPREHAAPVADCTCGLYAVSELRSVPLQSPSGSVLGCVALWGTVVEGERGWRAARGYPVVLFADPSFDEHTGRLLGERYGVAVFTLPTRLSAALLAHSPRLEDFARVVRELAARPRLSPRTEPDPELELAVGGLLEEIEQAELSWQRGSRPRNAKRVLVPVVLLVTALLSAVLTGWPVARFGQSTAPASLRSQAPAAAHPRPTSPRVPRAVAARETIVLNVPSLYQWRASRDGGVVAVSYGAGSVEVWNRAGGGFRRVPVAAPCVGLGFDSLALTPDGRTLVCASRGPDVGIYDTATGVLRATLPTGWVSYLAVSPDGHTLAHGGGNLGATIYLWNIDTGTRMGTLRTGRFISSPMRFNSDSTKLASGGANQAVRVWDVASGAQIAEMPPQERIPGAIDPDNHFVYHVAFSPDGRTLATAHGDGLRLWDLTTRRQIATLQVPGDPVSGIGGLTFSPDGTVLAVGAAHGIQLWNVATHALIPTQLPGAVGQEISFLPDGNTLLALAADGTLDKWSLTDG